MQTGTRMIITHSALFILFTLLSLTAAFAQGSPVSQVEITGLQSIPQEDLLDLLDIHKGEPLDRKLLQKGIQRAFSTGLFSDITVESLKDDESSLIVAVKERGVIDSISVMGNEHFSSGFIKKQTAIETGKRIHHRDMKRGSEELRKALRLRGFPEADVQYEIVPLKGNKVRIELNVREGSPQLIRELVISEPEDFVRSEIELAEGGVFDSTEMERLSQEALKYFKKQGYIKTSLQYSYTDGVLDIRLDRGTKVEVSFVGNTALSTKDLMREVPFFDVNAFSEDLVEESTSRIIASYHKEGYPFAQVAPTISADGDLVKVEFFIFEGDRYKVETVTLKPLSKPITLDQKRLKDLIILREGESYNPDQLSPDRDTLADLYHALGYLSVEVREPEVEIDTEKEEARLTFSIEEGEQVKVTGIEVKGNKLFPQETILKEIPLKKGNPYNDVDISESRRKILSLYNSKGFLDPQVTVRRDIKGAESSITFDIKEGDVTLFGKSVITGNDMTRQKVITRELIHKEGEPLDYSILIKERQRLYRLGIFTDVEITPVEQKGGKRDVKYVLKEANPGYVEFGLGYAEYEKLRGFFGAGYKNLWGTNRQIAFRTELSILEQRLTLSYYEPWFIRDIPLKVLALSEYRQERGQDSRELWYKIRRYSLSAGIDKEVTDTWKAEFSYDISQVKTWDIRPGIVLTREDVGTLLISGPRAGVIYDSRDNPFEPRSGVLGGLSLKVASYLLFSQTDFAKLNLYVNNYRALGKRVVLATSIRAGVAQGFRNTTELPIAERFFLGGRTTVRGYEQDTLGPKAADGTPIGGNTFLMGNLELRFDLGKGIGLVTFLDMGNVWTETRLFDATDLKYTTGLGLRYKTPVGPARVDYGYKLNREEGESVGELHFSLGHAF